VASTIEQTPRRWREVDFRAAADPFAPLLRPSNERFEAETAAISAIEPRYQTSLLGPDAGLIRSCSYDCKEAAVEVPGCHRKGGSYARRSPVVLTLLLASCPSAFNGEAALWEIVDASALRIECNGFPRGIRAPRHAAEET
jgi:hypothetical protein